MAYYQFERKIISEERLESAVNPIRARWCSAIFGQFFWDTVKSGFVDSYQNYIDSQIRQCERR